MKFIHTADWQIGMTFHGLREYSREAMSKARLEVIDAIADYANNSANGIDFVLVCGDMFQTPRISETLVKNTFKKIIVKKFKYFLPKWVTDLFLIKVIQNLEMNNWHWLLNN